jgi:hypothetical protein
VYTTDFGAINTISAINNLQLKKSCPTQKQ